MPGRPLELADVVRTHGDGFVASRGGRITLSETRVLRDVSACRTAALGGHVDECDHCGHQNVSYNSCRNRHCPKCQASARHAWLEERQKELLPVGYFHLVFTIPHETGAIAFQNKRVVYDILFQSACDTLLEVAANPKHLGARTGILAILHTWGQSLEHHPHVHCVVPAGGISMDEKSWVHSRARFLVPVKVLSRLFRGKFLHRLKSAFQAGQLSFGGTLKHLEDPMQFKSYIRPLFEKEWVVYAKPPFGSPKIVLRYLAQYTHRVAISNRRLISMGSNGVSFRWKDYKQKCRIRVMTLSAHEFLRRFLMHVLPRGFQRIRYYGILANRHREKDIQRCRELIAEDNEDTQTQPSDDRDQRHDSLSTGTDDRPPCPRCHKGRMRCILDFQPGEGPPITLTPATIDTS